MEFPENLRYTADHEWAKLDGDFVIVGITDFAQRELGDIVFVDITSLNETLDKESIFGTIDAVKTVSELFMPISGPIVEVNPLLQDAPEKVNSDPYNEGWMIKIKPNDICDFDTLMDAAAYQSLVS